MIRSAADSDEAALLAILGARPTHFVDAATPLVKQDFREHRTFVYEEAGTILGFLVWSESPVEIEMLWLAVLPQAARQGIGRALVTHVERQATGQRRIFLKTATTDSVIAGTQFSGAAYEATTSFFVELGYRVAGRVHNGWGPGNHCLIMEKLRADTSWTRQPTAKRSKDSEATSAPS